MFSKGMIKNIRIEYFGLLSAPDKLKPSFAGYMAYSITKARQMTEQEMLPDGGFFIGFGLGPVSNDLRSTDNRDKRFVCANLFMCLPESRPACFID
jgi:hypothetical protein